MITLSLYRRLYAAALLVVLAFALIGGIGTHWVLGALEQRINPRPPFATVQAIERALPADRATLLARLEKGQAETSVHFTLTDERSNVIYPPGGTLPNFSMERDIFDHPPLPPDLPMGPPTVRSWKLSGNPTQYLYIAFDSGKEPFIPIFLLINGSLLVSLASGVGFALLLILRSFKHKVELADGVINELKHGNLKARFPIRRMDEVGEFMNRFNQMADEIERVVEQMRNGERARMTLLQDLAHDLRTPVASMKHMLEILQLRDAGLDTQTRLKLLGLSILEVDYFARLVEDLLVLAQVNEPRYQANQSVLNMNELLLAEIERLEQLPSRDPALSIEKALLLDALPIRGDEQLLRRMLRNVLDNAASFARSRVSVKLEKIDSMKIRLTVEDDGPGFSPEALRCYGERRISRSLGSASANSEPGRVSVGLGSVIARTIAHLHRGNVLAQNSGSGACVVFTLPSEAERG